MLEMDGNFTGDFIVACFSLLMLRILLGSTLFLPFSLFLAAFVPRQITNYRRVNA